MEGDGDKDGNGSSLADTGPTAVPRLVLPYDEITGEIRRLRRIDEILTFDQEVRQVTKDFHLPIRLGCLLRAPICAWPNLGIEVTDENGEELERLANSKYLQDAEEGRLEKTASDALYRAKKKLGKDMLREMATFVSRLVTEIMIVAEDKTREFHVCDIASGAGRLSSAIAASLSGEGTYLDRVVFHLVDYASKLDLAEKNVAQLGARVVTHNMRDDAFLGQTKQKFDFVVSISHLHRKPVLSTHLRNVHAVLRDDGVLVSGDRHSILTQHPAHICSLLEHLGVAEEKIEYFKDLLRPLILESKPYDAEDDEFNAMNDHGIYWKRLENQIRDQRYDGKLRVRILGGFLSTRQLLKELDQADFDTDIKVIRKAFPRKLRLPSKLPMKLKHGSDSSAVTVAIKRCSR